MSGVSSITRSGVCFVPTISNRSIPIGSTALGAGAFAADFGSGFFGARLANTTRTT
jgi:hypothetical protein